MGRHVLVWFKDDVRFMNSLNKTEPTVFPLHVMLSGHSFYLRILDKIKQQCVLK